MKPLINKELRKSKEDEEHQDNSLKKDNTQKSKKNDPNSDSSYKSYQQNDMNKNFDSDIINHPNGPLFTAVHLIHRLIFCFHRCAPQ